MTVDSLPSCLPGSANPHPGRPGRPGRPVAFALCGPIASGKDAIARAALEATDVTDALMLAFADAIKDDVHRVVTAVRDVPAAGGNPDDAVRAVVSDPVVSIPAGANSDWAVLRAENAVHALWGDVGAVPQLDNRTMRTDGIRTAHQEWGRATKAIDAQHWITPVIRQATDALAAGRSVVVTDARLLSEREALRSAGFEVVLVAVTRKTQLARLAARGDDTSNVAALDHPTERELQSGVFDLTVGNDGEMSEAVAAVTAMLEARAIENASHRKWKVQTWRPGRGDAASLGLS